MLIRGYKKTDSASDWRLEGFKDISDRLNDSDFPCLFGRHAWKINSLLFTFVSHQEMLHNMLESMRAFIDRTHNTRPEERLYSPLVMIFEPSDFESLDAAHLFAWQRLQEMHDGDLHSWPDAIPDSPDDSAWSFCFGGTELFINISCPGHKRFRSRNLGQRVVFIINPRAHFDILASHQDIKGIKVREKIRMRVRNYNNGHIPDELGFYGDENNLEWKQYQLREPGAAEFSRCPLHIHKEKKKS
nr:YqcI/YcgG family protein [Erwinia endophytica]